MPWRKPDVLALLGLLLLGCSQGRIAQDPDAGADIDDGAAVEDEASPDGDGGFDEDVPGDPGGFADEGGEGDTGTDVAPAPSRLSAVWANEGGDKVAREELRASTGLPVANSVWDGTRVAVFGARNEVVSFVLVLEAAVQAAPGVSVTFDRLSGPGGASINSEKASGNGVFNWVYRPIELFYIRYLQIRGLSRLSYETYDERHVPKRFRRPWTGEGNGSGGWADRPDHDRHYPDIAVPLELVPSFEVPVGQSQCVWVDIFIPRDAAAGIYSGTVAVEEQGRMTHLIPVELTVRNFALPGAPGARTMLYLGYEDVNLRYLGEAYPDPGGANGALARQIRDRHFQLAHRHRISLIGDPADASDDAPGPDWPARLDGSLFAAAAGYDGPGTGVGNGVYSIATYGSWGWAGEGEASMRLHADNWVSWFDDNAPETEYFLYLIDESDDYGQIQQWAEWIENDPGPGKRLMSMATISLVAAAAHTPALDVAASTLGVGVTSDWESASASWRANPSKRFYLYNGARPASGSFCTEDDGVALRELAWGQYKKGIGRWFYWESTYYHSFQGNDVQTNVFSTAQTFGGAPSPDSVMGETSWNYTNGDGVLFYPGTDTLYPQDSYGVHGPFASLRLKHWRRGNQDFDYLALAAAKAPAQVQAILDRMIPKVLWEYGVSDPGDPTWVRTDISWSNDPDVWEDARRELADLIE